MRPELHTRLGALMSACTLGCAAGVAVAAEPAPSTSGPFESVLPPVLTPLGDLEAAARALRARAGTRDRAVPALRFPVAGKAGFGEAAARFGNDRGGHVHAGQDVFARAGTPLRAITRGIVVEKGGGDARGNHVALFDRRRNRTYVYFHMQAPAPVSLGQRVRAGQRVGRVGCTGRCSGDHLHIEVRIGRGADGRAIDPMGTLRRARNRQASASTS